MSHVPMVAMADTATSANARLLADTQLKEHIRRFVTKGQSSISGLSSGAFMTVQMHLAHSSRFCGAGIIAGGPFCCAETFRDAAVLKGDANILTAYFLGMNPLIPSIAPNGSLLANRARELAQDHNRLDDISHLRDHRIYLFSGIDDSVVYQSSVEQTRQFYLSLGINPRNLDWVNNIHAGHAIITANPEDSPLGTNQPPYINNGGFIQSHDILKTIYPDSHFTPTDTPLTGKLHRFSQVECMPGASEHERRNNLKRASMSEFGYVYVPGSVVPPQHPVHHAHHTAANPPTTNPNVRLHMVMHGCKQGYNYIPVINGRPDTANFPPYGNRYITTTGYNEYADQNDMVVIYPQAEGLDNGEVQNPDGCWDWWGYTGDDFYSKQALQIQALSNMLQQFGG